jgi:hypothetical protein
MPTDPISRIKDKRQAQTDAKEKQALVDSLESVSSDVRELLASLETSGAKKLDRQVVSSIAYLGSLVEAIRTIKISNDDETKKALREIANILEKINVQPVVKVSPTPVNITEKEVDFKPVVDAIKNIKIPTQRKLDTPKDLIDEVSKVVASIKGLRFPASNFILPFKNTSGAATQVQLTSSGELPVSATIDTSGLALDATLKDNSQTTQIVDVGGEGVTVTDGKLDVNALVSETRPSGASVSSVTMTGSSVTLASSNTSRRSLTIFNNSGGVVYVKLGTSASSSSFTVKMIDQSYYELPYPVYTGSITGFGSSGDLLVTEIT